MRRMIVSGLVAAVASLGMVGASAQSSQPNCEERGICVDNGDGTITDLSSGLMWVKNLVDAGSPGLDSPPTANVPTWQEAVDWAENLVYVGYDDWRLVSGSDLGTGLPDTESAFRNEPLPLWVYTWNLAAYGAYPDDILPFEYYLPILGWTDTENPDLPGEALTFWWGDEPQDLFPNGWRSKTQRLAAVPVRDAGLRVEVPPDVGPNVNATSDAATDQNEPMVAFNPLDENKLVVGYNDDAEGTQIRVGWSWSDDGGTSWTKGGRFDFAGYNRGADPVVAFDSAGTAYMTGIAFNPCFLPDCLGVDGSVFFAKSSDGGKTFESTQLVVTGDGVATVYDKPWLAVNPENGHIYLAWVQRLNAWNYIGLNKVPGSEDMSIWFTRSTNGGVTFEPPREISLRWGSSYNMHGPMIAVGGPSAAAGWPGGTNGQPTVYVAWHSLERGTLGQPGWEPPHIFITKSRDSGALFFPDFRVGTIENGLPHKFISVAANPVDGDHVYIAYSDRRTPDSNADRDVYVTMPSWPRQWSEFPPEYYEPQPWRVVRVNDSLGGEQTWPSIDVAPNGRIDVIWYDSRYGGWDVFYSSSANHGTTFATKNTNVTRASWPGSPNFDGDYITVASLDEKAQAVWMDNRGGNQEIYTATLSMLGQASFINTGTGDLNVTPIAEADLSQTGKPEGVVFPLGPFSTRVDAIQPGSTVTITIHAPFDIASPVQYWATVPVCFLQDGCWRDLTALIGDDDGDNVLTLTITDEGFGDDQYGVPGVIGNLGAIALAGETIPVEDLNGIPGVQCPGSNCSDGNYTIEGFPDVVRVALAGMHHDDADNIGMQDCNSDVRWTILESHPGLLVGTCTDASCEDVHHAWRLPDDAPGIDTFLQLLGLPAIDDAPFCNGDELEDNDPIRRACADGEDVCQPDGTLGWVLPIVPGPGSTEPCSLGVFRWKILPFTRFACPQGINPLFGLCLQPQDAEGNFGCLNPAFNKSFGTPAGVDGRVHNLWPLNADGTAPIVDGKELVAAFDRIHTANTIAEGANVCLEPAASDRIACLTEASPCSMAAECSGGQ